MSLRLATPGMLLLLVLAPMLLVWARRRWPQRTPSLRYADTRLAAVGGESLRARLRGWLPALRALVWVLLVLAAARPQAGQGQEIVRGEGVDIALALDISGSMVALDFQPDNRLETAKRVIQRFIENRPFDRIGLVVFASQAFDQSPPSVDHDVLSRQLAQVKLSTELGLQDGTAVGLGLARATHMLDGSAADSRVVILLTDGVNNAGQIDPLTAADAAATLGIKVYTIGVGRTGQVPVPVQGVFGRDVVYRESQLDEETLREIARRTGGRYFRAQDADTLAEIYAQIDALEKSEVEVQAYTEYRELAGWLLVPALLLLAAEGVLRRTWLAAGP